MSVRVVYLVMDHCSRADWLVSRKEGRERAYLIWLLYRYQKEEN